MVRVESRRWLPLALVVAAVMGVASSVGAQVDPADPADPALWGASCIGPGQAEIVVYGRGWAVGPVTLEAVSDGAGVVGTGVGQAVDASGTGARFQSRLTLGIPAGAATLEIVATQAGRRAGHRVSVTGSCRPTIAAVTSVGCALPGRPVSVVVTVRGAPASAYDVLVHHADLYGPAEAVDRRQPGRPAGDYAFALGVPNVPDRVVPVTLEARRVGGGFTYATADVGLPPACTQASTTLPTSPTTAPVTTQPAVAPTTSSTSPGPAVPVPPFGFQPGSPGESGASLALLPALGRAGEATTVAGRGFAPSSTVTLRWRPGIGQWTVRAGGDGSFRTQVLVLPKDIEGRRQLEVLEGGAAPAPYLVVPGSDQPAFGGVFIRS